MKNTLIEVTGKLPDGLVELYTGMALHAGALNIEFLVVGAMARDLVLVHGFHSKIERGTRDVDFAINVSSWQEFNSLREVLLRSGYRADPREVQKLYLECSDKSLWEIDILPFGAIEDENSSIAWPPDQDIEMSVLGFEEAEQNALQVRISKDPELIVKVPSPAGMSVLKLISWLERDANKRKKDAADLRYLIRTYVKIPEILTAVYEEGLMEEQGFDVDKASAMKLGVDAASIASPETKEYLRKSLFEDEQKFEMLIREMAENSHSSLEECESWITIFKAELIEGLVP